MNNKQPIPGILSLYLICFCWILMTCSALANNVAWTAESHSAQFEVLLKSPALQAGQEAPLEVYLADFASNQPIANAKVNLQFEGGPSAELQALSPGVYQGKFRFEALKTTSAIVNIRTAKQGDLLVLENIPLAQQTMPEPASPPHAKEHAQETTSAPISWLWFLPVLLLLGLGVIFLGKKYRRTLQMFLALSMLGTSFQRSGFSHEGGHDIVPTDAQNASVGKPILIDKSTQFELKLQTALAEQKSVAQEIETTGQVEVQPQYQAFVQAPLSGAIKAPRLPLVGDYVQRGQYLFSIEEPFPAQERLAVQNRELELKQNREALDLDLKLNTRQIELATEAEALAYQQRERVKELEAVIARKELPIAELELKKAQQALDATLAERQRLQSKRQQILKTQTLYQQANNNPGKRSHAVYAPISGHIDMSNLRAGQQAKAGDTLLEIHNLNEIWVQGQIYEKDLSSLGYIRQIDVFARAYPNKRFQGELYHIADRLDTQTQSIQAIFRVANPDHLLKIGMNVRLKIPQAQKTEALILPRSAIYEKGGQSWVFALKQAEYFTQRRVELGPVIGDYQVIYKGVAAGERIASSQVHTIYTQSLTGGQE